jgi:hypothetical protein
MTTRIAGPHVVMPIKLDGTTLRIGQHLEASQIEGRRFPTLTAARAKFTSGYAIVRVADGRVMAVKWPN